MNNNPFNQPITWGDRLGLAGGCLFVGLLVVAIVVLVVAGAVGGILLASRIFGGDSP